MRQPGLFRELRRRPAGLSALLVLGILYSCALWAPFLAPYPASEQSLNHSYHSPTRLFWKDGGVHVQIYQNVDPAAAAYQPVPEQSFPLPDLPRVFSPNILK